MVLHSVDTVIGIQTIQIGFDALYTGSINAGFIDHFFFRPVHYTGAAGENKIIHREIRPCQIGEGPDAAACVA